MSDLLMVDSAFPPQQHTADICLVYIGGDTPHSWTESEILAQPARYRLPTWVRSNPSQVNATSDAGACVATLHRLRVPEHTTVVLDLEIAINTGYVDTFNRIVTDGGYKVMKYGSKGFIFGNPKTSGGTFVADPTGVPHEVTIGDTLATQYAFIGNRYDLSLVRVTSTDPLWDVRGHQPPPPHPVNWLEKVLMSLPTIAAGPNTGNAWLVYRLQGELRGVGKLKDIGSAGNLTIDGSFGPNTQIAVEGIQAHYGLQKDGVVGPKTWSVLIAG